MIRAISGISYTVNGVMVVAFTEPGVPNEEWNLALAAVPINSLIQAPYSGPDVVDPEEARGHQMVICLFTDPANNITTKFVVDVRDINDGADYATPQDLIDEIVANIPAGGGGGVASVLADAPLDSSGGANPTISIDLTGASDGDVLTVDTGAAVWAPATGGGITSINLNTGPAIELRIPLDAMWAQINNAGAPAAGEFEANSNVDATAVTSLTFHILDAGTNDQSAWFASMRIGGLITGRQTDNNGTNTSGSPCIYRITAAPTLASSRYTIAVAHVSGLFQGSSPNWYVSYAGNTPLMYEAVLNNVGVVQWEGNDFSTTFTITNPNPGEFLLTADAGTPFTANKTFAWLVSSNGGVAGSSGTVEVGYSNTSEVRVFFFDAIGNLANPLGNFTVFIKVRP